MTRPIIWARLTTQGRGPARTIDYGSITSAAIAIADESGLDAVSMRRIGDRIGRSAMSLYRHIDGKEDLTELMYDTALGELDLDAIPGGDWRSRLASLCAELRALYLKHPWLSRLGQRPALGPNSLRQLEFAFAIVDGLGLDIDGMLDLASTALQFTQGFVQGELSRADAQTRTGMDDAAWRSYVTPYVEQLLAENPGGYFQRIILDAEDFPDADALFTRRLAMVLDGLAVRIAQSG